MIRLARAYRRALVPLAAYYAVTLGLPIVNGAARSGTPFFKHAIVVLLVPLAAIALGSAVHTVCTTAGLALDRNKTHVVDAGAHRPLVVGRGDAEAHRLTGPARQVVANRCRRAARRCIGRGLEHRGA